MFKYILTFQKQNEDDLLLFVQSVDKFLRVNMILFLVACFSQEPLHHTQLVKISDMTA